MSIPDEAVETAARKFHDSLIAPELLWEHRTDQVHAYYCAAARVALEATRPIINAMLAEAKAEALREAAEDARLERSRCSEIGPVKCGDGFAYIKTEPYGVKYWGEMADWLRARADRIEKP